ncbi:proline-specific peptidase [Lentinula edodes]|uniref:Proline-specific peptidase n=1 Tax=Lentinula lateritia TaxID=40482 RepID=A0A9W9DDI3_9AGAR|nr:proline-specific peptidase [Lentinula edodes]
MSFIIGTTDFHYAGEIFKTWYKVVGSLDSTQRPLIALHGGPGMSHDYILPHSRLHELYGIPVIFYDQIGIGKSTHLPNKPKEFWTSELFMDELENLLQSLGVSSDFDLLGCSWGGMLGVEWAAKRHPKGLKRLLLIGTPASMELWVESQNKLLQGLDKDVHEALTKHEQVGTTHDPEYEAGMGLFYKKHANRLETWPEELLKSVASTAEDPTVYHTMNGPSEFCITGSIKTWSVIDLLESIDYTTLITNSEYDMAQDITILPFFKCLAKVKWVKFHNASHHPFWEIPEEYLKVVGEFLTM